MKSPLDTDLARLFSAFADGILSDADHERLEQRLSADAAARREFLSWMAMESALDWGVASLSDRISEPVSPSIFRWPGSRAAGFFAAGVACAVIAVVGAVALSERAPREKVGPAAELPSVNSASAQPAPSARISDVTNARWHGTVQWQEGETVPIGPLQLTAGSAQLAFASGAKVALNAPAEVEVLSPNRLFLRSGSVVPFVPASARGFTVVCPSGEVVDLGTEFSMRVDRDGRAHVYVIDGEVDVAGGHEESGERLRMTQGYGTLLSATPFSGPSFTQRPIIVDHFDAEPSAASQESRLVWSNFDRDYSAEVKDGSLRIPIDGGVDRRYPIVRAVLEHDLTALVGSRSTIAFKAALPDMGTAPRQHRWAGIVLDDAAQPNQPEAAYKPTAALGVLVSPSWQVQVLEQGTTLVKARVFARDADAVGPYQVVVTLDDSPASHGRHGSATASVTVNGLEVLHDHPIDIGRRPRLQFQTHTKANSGGRGMAIIDDVCVSVEVPAAAEPGASIP
jgi:anti-sigma factor RsiW